MRPCEAAALMNCSPAAMRRMPSSSWSQALFFVT
jgi:hypothetical protein